MTDFADLQRDSDDLGALVNENRLVSTRYGGDKKSWQYLVDQFEAEFAQTLLEINKSRGYRVVGTFTAGFDYELFNDVGIDSSGNSWIYVGAGAPVATVAPSTDPSLSADYQQVTFNDANNVQTNGGGTVQDYININENLYKNSSAVDVILVYGQSNARGYAGNTDGAPTNNTELCRVWDGSAFIPLTSYTPTANDGTSTGSAWAAFGNEYATSTGRKSVILNAAKGSQSVADLQKGGANYTALTNWYNGAVAEIVTEGSTVGKVILMFSQGEQDSDIETAPTTYYSQINQLWTDIKTDFYAEIMGLYTVGYYADARMIHGQAIQQAQRKFARDNSDVVIAYDDLAAFGSGNNLKVDGVHYNQRGYNIMGLEGAKTIVNTLFSEVGASESQQLIKHYGSEAANQSQNWTKYGGVIRKASDSDWRVNHSQPYASSMILSAVRKTGALELVLNGDVGTVLNFNANFGGDLIQRGMRVAVGTGTNSVSGIVGSTDADGYSYVDIIFRSDVYLNINMATQTVTTTQGTPYTEILNELTVTFPSVGRCDIAHPEILGGATGSIIGGTGRSIRVNTSASSTILQLRDSSDALVDEEVTVLLPNMLIDPNSIPDTADLNVEIIAADYAVW